MARWRRELRQKSAQWLDLHEDYMMEAGRQSFAENARESRNSIVHSLAKFLGKFLGGDTPTAEGAHSRTSTTPYRFAVFRFEGKTVRSEVEVEKEAAAPLWASSSEDGAVLDALHGYQTRQQQFAVVALRIPGGRRGPQSKSAARRTTVRDVFDAPGDERETRKNYARIADRIVLVLLHGRKKNSFKLEEGSGKKKANERKPVLLPLDSFPTTHSEFGPLMHQTLLPFAFLRSVLMDPNFRRFERSAVRSFVEALEREFPARPTSVVRPRTREEQDAFKRAAAAAGVDPATAAGVEAELVTLEKHMIRFQDFTEELRKRFHLREEAEMLAREIWGEAVGRHLLMPTEVAPPFSMRFFPTEKGGFAGEGGDGGNDEEAGEVPPRALVVPDEIIANDDRILKSAGADKELMLEVSGRFFDRVLNYEEEPTNAALTVVTTMQRWGGRGATSAGMSLGGAALGGASSQVWPSRSSGNPTLRFELELANSAFQYSLRSVDRVVDAMKAAHMQLERSRLRSATVFSIFLGATGKARGKEQAFFAKSFGVVGLKSTLQFPHAMLSDSPELSTPGAQVQTRWYKWQRQEWVPAEDWAAGVEGTGHGEGDDPLHLAHLRLKNFPLFLSGEDRASSQSHDQDAPERVRVRGALDRDSPRNSATQQWQYGPKSVYVIASNEAWQKFTEDDGVLLRAERDAAGKLNVQLSRKQHAYLQELGKQELEHMDWVAQRTVVRDVAAPAEQVSKGSWRDRLRLKLREGQGLSSRRGGLQEPPAAREKQYQASAYEIPAGERFRWLPATTDALWREARSFSYGGMYKEPALLSEEQEEVEDGLHDDDENVVGKRFVSEFHSAWAAEQRTQLQLQASGKVDRARNEEGQRTQTGIPFDAKSSVFLHRFCDDSMLGRTSGARLGVVSYDLQAMLL
eukprot:g2328.t1